MEPKLVIATLGKATYVFIDGKCISSGVKELIYSARDSEGNLNPTLKLLEVNVNDFTLDKEKSLDEFLKNIKETREMIVGAKPESD